MIESGTVLILGAGASKPYGFPLGTELRSSILEMTKADTMPGFKPLVSCGFTPSEIQTFRMNLHDALHDTIDDFLSDRPTFRKIGAHAIAAALMSCEDHSKVFPKRDWYPRLFQLLDFKNGHSLLNGIITLNYDRSLEHYLTQTIEVSYEGQTKVRAMNQLGQFPIYHVHGTLGDYPMRAYHKKVHTEEVKKAADDLRITSDGDLDHSPAYKAAKQLCSSASCIVFLGFGYHERVMTRLGFQDGFKSQPLMGTAYNLNAKRRKQLQDQFQSRLVLDDRNWQISTYFENVVLQ